MSRSRSVAALRRAAAPAEVEALLPALAEHAAAARRGGDGGLPAGVRALKAGAVYRVGGAVVKLYQRSPNPLARLRPPRAARAAAAHGRLFPVRSPEPLHWRRLAHPRFESLLVYAFAEGVTLTALWPDPPVAARAALPRLFADLHAGRVLHGDLHGGNLLWDGDGWIVLDLDGLRHGLHLVRRRAITEKVWARLARDLGDLAEAEALYRASLARCGGPWEPDASWARIRARFEARRAVDRGGAGAVSARRW